MTPEIIQYIMIGCIGFIGYLLKAIHTDFKELVKSVTGLRDEQGKIWQKLTLVETTATKDLATLQAVTNERLNTLVEYVKKQTETTENMAKKIEHLDNNTANVKIFFEKYEAVENRLINLENGKQHRN
jgi:hypothetical protein